MNNGISIYPGLDNTLEENLELIDKAAACGFRRIFTSLHIPETNVQALKRELSELLREARRHDMEIISDISPATMELLGIKEFSPSAFRMLGITTLRLDYGFGLDEIVKLSHNKQDIRIQLNASTITGKLLSALVEMQANFRQIDALHNFYPRRGTGISEECLVRKTMMLHKLKIKTGAFVPSQGRRRSPLQDGLPTMEDHRDESAELAARHLIALGIDSIFISDSLPTEEELRSIGSLNNNQVTLGAKLLTKDPVQRELLSHTFTARADEARDAIRAEESRQLLKEMGKTIQPDNTIIRPIGAVTLDNIDYKRYMGELQIIRAPQAADARTNVAAMVEESEVNMLQYITPGRKFSFRFKE
ncbi:DUF871 domain-containing protein [Selenomonas sp. ND2010]|uniref:DUF871 domain-containing protein n=1 Tax=Selenomonas sp. ND2010 TaxID=1410618 RepID=UPI00051BEEDE|nr:MupG family TIM beta-alpha barrel fold protein [Selenomonas sp. ND2010]